MTAHDAPVSPLTVSNLLRTTSQDYCLQDVADVVSTDNGLALRVMAVANSAAFGLARQVTDISQAVGLVGAGMVQTLAIAGSCRLLESDRALPGMRRHAIEQACAARTLAASAGLAKHDAFAAGLLHDVGELLLWQRDPEAYSAAHRGFDDVAEQLRYERGTFGTDHPTLAREQLAEWGLPGGVVDAIGDHHRPDLSYPDLSTVLVAAEELMDADCAGSRRLEVLGVAADQLDALRSDVADQADELDGVLAGV